MTIPPNHAGELIRTAIGLGAAEAVLISPSLILVEDHLAELCKGNPGCPNYGLSSSCPPHVAGPAAFRQWQSEATGAVIIRMDFPPAGVMTPESLALGRLLHEIVSGVESRAVDLGYAGSKSFAGGSCKNLFCPDYPSCRVLSENGSCRNPQSARPSVSGFGINVSRLMASVPWDTPPGTEGLTWMMGIVLLLGSNC